MEIQGANYQNQPPTKMKSISQASSLSANADKEKIYSKRQNINSPSLIKNQSQKPITNISPVNFNIISQKPRTQLKKKLGEYQFCLDHKLGSGLTSDVYLGINTHTNQQVCVKVIDKLNFTKQQQKLMLENQIRCQKKFKNDHIVKIHDIFETETFTFIINQFCDHGDLYKLIKYTKNGLEENLVKTFIRDIATGLNQMRKKQIVHRDIKSQNILLRKGIAKLGDFGFAIQKEKLIEKQKLNIGSPLYMSPQVLNQNKYSFASDIFAFGVVIYQMLHKQSPWQCDDENQLKKKIQSQPVQFKSGLSDEIKQLIKGCLNINANKRITIEQIMNLEYLKRQQGLQKDKKQITQRA